LAGLVRFGAVPSRVITLEFAQFPGKVMADTKHDEKRALLRFLQCQRDWFFMPRNMYMSTWSPERKPILSQPSRDRGMITRWAAVRAAA
jgi:hypothetical protein